MFENDGSGEKSKNKQIMDVVRSVVVGGTQLHYLFKEIKQTMNNKGVDECAYLVLRCERETSCEEIQFYEGSTAFFT